MKPSFDMEKAILLLPDILTLLEEMGGGEAYLGTLGRYCWCDGWQSGPTIGTHQNLCNQANTLLLQIKGEE